MPYLSPSDSVELTMQTESSSSLGRVYSEETDESPFGSNLVTPTDEESNTYQGIHERLDAAETALGYFASKGFIAEETEKAQPLLHQDTPEDIQTVEIEHCESLEKDKSITGPSLDNLGSTDPIASPVLSSSSSESVRMLNAGSIYTLPNDHIMVESPSYGSNSSADVAQDEGRPLLESDSIPIIKNSDLGPNFWLKELEPLISTVTFRALISIGLRLVCFLPWCVAVGGALMLSPEHIDYIAFRPGYIGKLSGIRRYAYWAEYGYQHVVAFLGFLGVVMWAFPTAGLLLAGGLLAQFCSAWHAFLFDRTIPLGEDDQQTVYLLATSTWKNNTSIDIRKVGDSYYSTGIPTKRESSEVDTSSDC